MTTSNTRTTPAQSRRGLRLDDLLNGLMIATFAGFVICANVDAVRVDAAASKAATLAAHQERAATLASAAGTQVAAAARAPALR